MARGCESCAKSSASAIQGAFSVKRMSRLKSFCKRDGQSFLSFSFFIIIIIIIMYTSGTAGLCKNKILYEHITKPVIITDLLNTLTVGSWHWDSVGPEGLARTLSSNSTKSYYPHLSARCDGQTLLWLATGLAPRKCHKDIPLLAFPVPGCVAPIKWNKFTSLPDYESFLAEIKMMY